MIVRKKTNVLIPENVTGFSSSTGTLAMVVIQVFFRFPFMFNYSILQLGIPTFFLTSAGSNASRWYFLDG